MADPTPITAAPRWHRGLYIAALAMLLLLSSPQSSCGQETAAVVDEAAVAADAAAPVDGDIAGDVTDLGDIVGDAMADLTSGADTVGSVGAADGASEKVAEEPVAEEIAAAAAAAGGEEAVDAATTKETTATDASESEAAPASTESEAQATGEETAAPVVQSGPYIDLLGDVLLSLEMVDEAHAQVHQHYTNEALAGKKVVGLYFSADWCGPCRQFTPDLVNFYNKMNARRGKQNEFEIVWISRCRTVDDFGQYFTQMNWLALPPNEAMGQRGQYLGEKYKVKGIPTLVLLDEIGNVITTDARNKIPMDKAGIGFPWRSPVSVLISTLVPKSFRLMAKSQVSSVVGLVKKVLLGKKDKLKEALKGRAA